MPMRCIFPYIIAVAIALSPAALVARDIFGSESLEYKMAVEAWLNGEDMDALSKFAKLSRNGNVAAQLLLASIAARANMHVHVTSKLSREDRIDLLRIPKGLSGKSWLSEAQTVEPLATALLQSSKTGEKAPAIAALIEYGEPNTALLAAQSMLLQGQAQELIPVLQGLEQQLPKEAAFLLEWAISQAANSVNARNVGSARVGAAYLNDRQFRAYELAWLGFGPRHIVENNQLRNSIHKHYENVRPWTPVSKFCRTHCSETVPNCVAVGVSASWSVGAFGMRSPLETVISDDLYWSSPRIEGDIARQIQDVTLWRDWTAFTQLDSCFFDSMESLQKEHGYAR